MKKTIVLLLSLILLFSFVRCNGSTKSPSDSSSSNDSSNTNNTNNAFDIVYEKIPDDITPPSSSTWIDISEQDKNSIDEALNSVKKDVKERYQIMYFEFKDNVKIEDKTISGKLNMRFLYLDNKIIFNGSFIYDGVKYELIDYTLPMSGSSSVISGTIKINNKIGTISDFMSLTPIFTPIFNDPDPNNFSEMIDYVYEKSQLSSKNETRVLGQLYNEHKYIMSENVDEEKKVISAVIGNDTFVYKHTRDYTIENESDNLKINYLGFNNKFFTEDSVKTSYPYGIFI